MAAMTQALTDADYDCFVSVLERFRNERAMNLEMLDGFFVALICCPDMVRPSEYLPEIWGGNMADNEAFSDQAEAQKFLILSCVTGMPSCSRSQRGSSYRCSWKMMAVSPMGTIGHKAS